jgi:hypothetical protein
MLCSDSIKIPQGGAVFSSIPSNIIAAIDRNIVIKNCYFSNNTINVNSNYGGFGAAAFIMSQSLDLISSNFSDNVIGSVETKSNLFPQYFSGGGALYISSSIEQTKITGCNFDRNYIVGGGGGALYLFSGKNVEIEDCNFNYNAAWSSYTVKAQGGAIMAAGRTGVVLKDSSFTYNQARPRITNTNPVTYSGEGGAIYLQSSTLNLTHSDFSSNYVITGQFDSGAGGLLN